MNAADFYPDFKSGKLSWYPDNIVQLGSPLSSGRVWYVDGDLSTGGAGRSWSDAYTTIQAAVTAASAGDVIYVAERTITALATDPVSYAETIIIPNATSSLSIIGVSRGRTQGGLPQIKKGAGATALLTVRAPGCLIANLGFNGASATGGGILLDDDEGTSKVAFGTTITGCHFKNCVVTANDGRTGGAIYWGSRGGGWQTLISGNRFYKNEADIVVVGTTGGVIQDVVIENNIFGGPAASVDTNIYTGGSGISGLIINNNVFTAIPALSAGQVKKFVDLTGSVGILSNNSFASNDGTFKANGSVGFIPTTMFMAGNYQESSDAVGTFGSLTGRST